MIICGEIIKELSGVFEKKFKQLDDASKICNRGTAIAVITRQRVWMPTECFFGKVNVTFRYNTNLLDMWGHLEKDLFLKLILCKNVSLLICLPFVAEEDHTVTWQSWNAVGGCLLCRSKPESKCYRLDKVTLTNRQIKAALSLSLVWHVFVWFLGYNKRKENNLATKYVWDWVNDSFFHWVSQFGVKSCNTYLFI